LVTTASAIEYAGRCAGKRGKKSRQEVKDKLDELHDDIKAGIHIPATYTVRQRVADWLDSLPLHPGTVAAYQGQAEKWIYPKLGTTKLKEFKASDADSSSGNSARC
jgi:hypothetical protein